MLRTIRIKKKEVMIFYFVSSDMNLNDFDEKKIF